MASGWYNAGINAVMKNLIDLDGSNIWAALMMSNTTCDTENDGITFMGDFTTKDEMDGANYVRKKLANKSVTLDDANDLSYLDADDVAWTSLGNGTRAVQGVVLYVDADDDGDAADDAANRVLAWVEFATNQSPGGSLFTVIWPATGILKGTRV